MSDRQQDPWADLPNWADGGAGAVEAAGQPAGAAGDAGEATAAPPGAGEGPATCPWCAAPAAEGATRCTGCGAALAQRERIGDLVIPGLTAVDPALKDLDGRPLHLRGPSPTQGVASGVIVAAAAGGPVGLTILGGVAAVAAAEYLGAGNTTAGKGHENVGETSGAVLQALERLERGEALPAADETTARPELEAGGAQSADRDPGVPKAARQEEASDGGD